LVTPVISCPVITTRLTFPDSTDAMNSLNDKRESRVWYFVEKFQMSTPTTTSTIQNSKLFRVEFKKILPLP
jgi:hypothetical protein